MSGLVSGSDAGPGPAEVLVRPAGPGDAPALARVHLAARRAAPMPPPAHPEDACAPWLAARVAVDETWLAEVDGEPVAYVRLTGAWLDDLYVAPAHAGCGLGSMLLDLAKSRRPDGFGLWVFAANAPARRFYARHGLREREHTDGSGNEEGEPDVRLSWEPTGG